MAKPAQREGLSGGGHAPLKEQKERWLGLASRPRMGRREVELDDTDGRPTQKPLLTSCPLTHLVAKSWADGQVLTNEMEDEIC